MTVDGAADCAESVSLTFRSKASNDRETEREIKERREGRRDNRILPLPYFIRQNEQTFWST